MWGQENIWLIALLGFMAFVANVLYMLGGTQGFKKWLRRFVGSFILALSANIGALVMGVWTWHYCLICPCLTIGFSLGYGADTTIGKIIRRTIFASGVLTACWVGLWITGFSGFGWMVMLLAIITGLTSVALGVWNPFNNAPLEQFFVCQVLCLYIPYWCFIK